MGSPRLPPAFWSTCTQHIRAWLCRVLACTHELLPVFLPQDTHGPAGRERAQVERGAQRRAPAASWKATGAGGCSHAALWPTQQTGGQGLQIPACSMRRWVLLLCALADWLMLLARLCTRDAILDAVACREAGSWLMRGDPASTRLDSHMHDHFLRQQTCVHFCCRSCSCPVQPCPWLHHQTHPSQPLQLGGCQPQAVQLQQRQQKHLGRQLWPSLGTCMMWWVCGLGC